jgi:hypothetical protein
MATMTDTIRCEEPIHRYEEEQINRYFVIHPLDDEPEQKVDTDALGAMVMTPAVKWSLVSLRGYLVLMLLLVIYHVLQLAGLFGGPR